MRAYPINPRASAFNVAAGRDAAPSFSKMPSTCMRTLAGVMRRARAVSRLVWPRLTWAGSRRCTRHARGQGVVGSNHGMGGEDHGTVDATAAVSVLSCTPMVDRGSGLISDAAFEVRRLRALRHSFVFTCFYAAP